MADHRTGILDVGLYFIVGCVLQICCNALVPDVNIVPAQGQQGGNPPQPYPQNTGHYPHYNAYPQDPAYQVPGQTDPYMGNAYADQAYNQQSGGQLTPGQSGQQPMSYQDQFAANQAAGGYPPPAYPPYQGAPDPSLSQSQGAQTQPQAQASQSPGSSQSQSQSQLQPSGQAQQPQSMSATQPRTPMMQMPYQQNAGQSGQNPQQMNPSQYPYQYTGSYPPQAYAGQPPPGYPNTQSSMMPESAGFPASNSQAPVDPSGNAGGAAVGADQNQAPTAGAPPQGFQQPPVGSSQGQGFQPNASPDQGQVYQQPPGSNPSQGFAPPAGSNQAPGFAPPGTSSQSSNQGFAPQPNPGFAPGAPGASPQGFLQPGTPQNPNVPYSGNQGGGQPGEAGSPTAAGSKPADVPTSSSVSTQRQAAYKGQLTNAIQYNLADQKTGAFAPNGVPDPQSNMVGNGQSGFSQSQGQPAGGANPSGLAYPPQQPAPPVQQYQPGPYLGQSPTGAGPQPYPMRAPYPYPQPYPGQSPYQGPMSPYPGQGGMPYTDQQGRPLYPAPKSAMNPSRMPKQDPQLGRNQQPSNQLQRGPYNRGPQPNGYPPNNMEPPTTTPMPETTQPASTFPPELRCFSQNECEIGCCYASDGSILLDSHAHGYSAPSAQRKEGYCYTKTTTVPGDGCIPGVCPCQGMDQVCVSVPSENATMPTIVGEMAEGAVLGNPKCYTSEQQMQIIDWLKKLETIVTVCRLDPDCPLTIMH